MTAEYKKRAKGGWNVGKGAKSQSNRDERQYEKQEISELVEDSETNTVPKTSPKLSTLDKKLKNSLRDIRYVLKIYKSEEGLKQKIKDSTRDNWYINRLNIYLQRYKNDVRLIKSYRNSDSVDRKVRRQIEEVINLIGEINE